MRVTLFTYTPLGSFATMFNKLPFLFFLLIMLGLVIRFIGILLNIVGI